MQHMTARLAAIVGSEQVQDDGALLDDYMLDHSDAHARRPVAIVRPGSAEEVQQVVAWANETATPLVPVSSGGPHFHGDTVPSVPGAVMLDLRRLDRILRIDRRNRMTVIEPGVTYPQLQAALAEQGMRVTPPLLPRANKSVVASLLERQPTLIPRYNYALPEPLRDCGVVWGSGEVLYTGEAGSGSTLLEKQWEAGFVQAEAKGPAQTDFYRLLTGAQGTMGVVTWASVKCELLPEAHEMGFVTAGSLGELEPLVRGLCLSRLGDELMLFDRGYLSRMLAGTGVAADPEDLQAWTLVLGFGGRGFRSAERVRVQKEDATRLAGQVGLEVRGELLGRAGRRGRRAAPRPVPCSPLEAGRHGRHCRRLLPYHSRQDRRVSRDHARRGRESRLCPPTPSASTSSRSTRACPITSSSACPTTPRSPAPARRCRASPTTWPPT